MRQPLHDDEDLSIWFRIDESTDEAYIDIESSDAGPDLSVEGDVVVAIAGDVATVTRQTANEAVAELGRWEALESDDLELMIRVGEWFESWELQ